MMDRHLFSVRNLLVVEAAINLVLGVRLIFMAPIPRRGCASYTPGGIEQGNSI